MVEIDLERLPQMAVLSYTNDTMTTYAMVARTKKKGMVVQ